MLSVKQTPPAKSLVCLGSGLSIPIVGSALLSISILSLTCGSTLFSGDTFEDQIASLTWPCTLPPGWSVEWDTILAIDDNAE